MWQQKTMQCFVVDVAESMRAPVTSSKLAKIDLAKAIIMHHISMNIDKKTTEYGIFTYGDKTTNNYLNTNEGGYSNVNEIFAMAPNPGAEILNLINDKVNIGIEESDLVDGIATGLDCLLRFNADKKYNRNMILLTDGENAFTGFDDLESLVESMKSNFIFTYIAFIGKANESSSKIKRENQLCLKSVAEQTGGMFMEVENVGDSLYLTAQRIGFGVKPVKSKIYFELTPTIKISCEIWGKISSAKKPVSKKEVKPEKVDLSHGSNDTGSSIIPAPAAVIRDTSYRRSDEPEDMCGEIDVSDTTKGYKYGTTYIPEASVDARIFIVPGACKMQLLGFQLKEKVPKYQYLDKTLILQGVSDSEKSANASLDDLSYAGRAQFAILQLSVAMRKLNKVAIARYVKKDDADPVLVVISPPEKDDGTLLVHRLPCQEDSNMFVFQSFLNSSTVRKMSEEQKTAMSSLVDSMTIAPSRRLITPYNHSIHTFLHQLQQQVLRNPIAIPVNELLPDPFTIISQSNSLASRKQLIQDNVKKVTELFPLETDEKATKKRTYWTDLTISEDGDDTKRAPKHARQEVSESKEVEMVIEDNMEEMTKKALLKAFTASSLDPLTTFDNLLAIPSMNPSDVKIIFTKMFEIIEYNIVSGASSPYYRKSIEYILHTRAKANQLQMVSMFNDFMMNCIKSGVVQSNRHKHSEFLQMMVEKKVTLISAAESHASHITAMEADVFLSTLSAVDAPQNVVATITSTQVTDLNLDALE